MSFFKVSKSADDVKDSGGSNFINSSGFYPLTIKAACVDSNDKGARSITFLVDYEGQEQPLFGALKLDNNDGSPNFEMEMFNKLCVVCGIDEVAEPVEGELPIGKSKSMKECLILPDFEDVEVTLRIQMEYSLFNGEVKEKKRIRNVFRSSDNATAAEIVNDAEAGNQYEKEQKYADNVTYKDGLTPEDVEQYITNRKSGGGGTAKKNTTSKMTGGKSTGFGKKKFGSS